MSLDENKIIVIEPNIRSTEYRDFVKKSAVKLLKSGDFKLQSVSTEGHYVILKLSDSSQSGRAIHILRKLSGIAFIFVGVSVKPDYDTILNTITAIYDKRILDGETYILLVRSTILGVKDNESRIKMFDLEFQIQSELSATSGNLIRSENGREPDVILYILIGIKRCYISISVFKGQNNIPHNYLEEPMLCPIFDNVSMISFFSILNSGYNPVPFFFYLEKKSMKKMLKVFENIIAKSPIVQIDIYVVSMGELMTEFVQRPIRRYANKKLIKMDTQISFWLIFLLAILKILEKTNLQITKVGLPLTPHTHPPWLIKETIAMFNGSKKIALMPLLFNYSSQDFERDISRLIKQGLNLEHVSDNLMQVGELDQELFRSLLKEFRIDHFPSFSSKYLKKYVLRIGEDEILDIFDSI